MTIEEAYYMEWEGSLFLLTIREDCHGLEIQNSKGTGTGKLSCSISRVPEGSANILRLPDPQDS